MATFEIKTKRAMNVQGDYVDAGLSVQISSMFSNPFDEVDKIHKAFLRVHGIDLTGGIWAVNLYWRNMDCNFELKLKLDPNVFGKDSEYC